MQDEETRQEQHSPRWNALLWLLRMGGQKTALKKWAYSWNLISREVTQNWSEVLLLYFNGFFKLLFLEDLPLEVEYPKSTGHTLAWQRLLRNTKYTWLNSFSPCITCSRTRGDPLQVLHPPGSVRSCHCVCHSSQGTATQARCVISGSALPWFCRMQNDHCHSKTPCGWIN